MHQPPAALLPYELGVKSVKDVFLLGNAWTALGDKAREGRWEGRERFSCLQAMCSMYMRRPDGGCAAGGEDLQLDQHGLMLMLMLVLMGGDRLQLLGCHRLLLLGVFPVVDRTATHWTHRQPTVNTEQELVRQGTCVVWCVCVCGVVCAVTEAKQQTTYRMEQAKQISWWPQGWSLMSPSCA